MPPKSRTLTRKGSITSHLAGKYASDTNDSSPAMKNKLQPKPSLKMLPPPSPVSTTVLGPEMQVLEKSLKEAAFNAGRIFRFYTETKKEQIASKAPHPPRSITRVLGRSLERYDQICDTVETQLLHAISVLERDLRAEQARLEAEASASVATRTRSKRPSVSPTAGRIPLPNVSPPPPGAEQASFTESPTSTMATSQFPPSGASAISLSARRPSAILSSLHRPSFPLKLDLSPAALAGGNIDPAMMGQLMDVNADLGLTSLPSPVTLAPKTARAIANDPSLPDFFGVGTAQAMSGSAPDGSAPNEPGSISTNVGMKTTGTVQEEVIDLTGSEPSRGNATQLGDSADKPIELDMESAYDDLDLFGDVPSNDTATNAANATSQATTVTGASTQLDVDMDGLFTPQDSQINTFQLDEAMGQSGNAGVASDPDILASLDSNTSSNELSSLLLHGGGGGGRSVINADRNVTGRPSTETFPGLGSGGEPEFDLGIDLSSFRGLFGVPDGSGGKQSTVGGAEEGDLMQLLAMGNEQGIQSSGSGGNTGQ